MLVRVRLPGRVGFAVVVGVRSHSLVGDNPGDNPGMEDRAGSDPCSLVAVVLERSSRWEGSHIEVGCTPAGHIEVDHTEVGHIEAGCTDRDGT